jgi:HlyD family secretion protein
MILEDKELKAKFAFQDPDDFLESGQYAAIQIIKSYREDVLTVPINALYKDGVNYYVYKQEDGHSVRCDVKTGVISSTKAEILEGLEEGDVVYVKE